MILTWMSQASKRRRHTGVRIGRRMPFGAKSEFHCDRGIAAKKMAQTGAEWRPDERISAHWQKTIISPRANNLKSHWAAAWARSISSLGTLCRYRAAIRLKSCFQWSLLRQTPARNICGPKWWQRYLGVVKRTWNSA